MKCTLLLQVLCGAVSRRAGSEMPMEQELKNPSIGEICISQTFLLALRIGNPHESPRRVSQDARTGPMTSMPALTSPPELQDKAPSNE